MIKNVLVILFVTMVAQLGFAQAEPAGAQVPVNTQVEGHKLTVDIDVPEHITEKLDSKEIAKIIRLAIVNSQEREEQFLDEAILVPFIVFASIVVIVFISLYLPFRKYRELQETVRQMVKEKHDIPDTIFESLQRNKIPTRDADLRKGLLLSALGVGTSAIIFLTNPSVETDGSWGVGLLPLCIGLAYILLWYLGRDKQLDG